MTKAAEHGLPLWVFTLASVACFSVVATPASAAPGKCVLRVEGQDYINGPCEVDIGKGGDFGISSLKGSRMFYFVGVTLDPSAPGTATAAWNGKDAESHAHDELGTLTRKGACWSNERATICATATATGGAASNPQGDASAEQFIRQLYADEAKGDPGPQPEAIYDPELLALVRRDRAMMEKYEKGLLRVDPICACQDADGLTLMSVRVQPKDAGRADASVSFSLSGPHTFTYQLVSAGGQWRIHDILGGIAPSLRQYLATGLAREERELKRVRR